MQNTHSSIIKKAKKTTFSLGLPIVGLLAALLIHGCDQISRNEEIQSGKTNVTAEEVGDLSGSASGLIGKEVTIRNQVTKAIDKNGFVMNSEGASSILVINATGAPFDLRDQNIPVQATGIVESFVTADIEKKYGLDLDPNLYADYDRKPAVVAKSLAFAPTPEDLAETPAGYFNQTIAVKGEVRKISTSDATPGSFALFEKGWVDDIGVLVVGVDRNLKGTIQEGELVVVTGTARQPDAAFLQKNLGWDANKAQEFLSRYKDRPVIVAEYVFPSAVSKE